MELIQNKTCVCGKKLKQETTNFFKCECGRSVMTPQISFDFFEDYPNVEIIDNTVDCVLGKSLKNNKAYFYYNVNEDLTFCFHMLCEVGERYRVIFEAMLQENNLTLSDMETENDFFEIIVGN